MAFYARKRYSTIVRAYKKKHGSTGESVHTSIFLELNSCANNVILLPAHADLRKRLAVSIKWWTFWSNCHIERHWWFRVIVSCSACHNRSTWFTVNIPYNRVTEIGSGEMGLKLISVCWAIRRRHSDKNRWVSCVGIWLIVVLVDYNKIPRKFLKRGFF